MTANSCAPNFKFITDENDDSSRKNRETKYTKNPIQFPGILMPDSGYDASRRGQELLNKDGDHSESSLGHPMAVKNHIRTFWRWSSEAIRCNEMH